jgi:hypothetical protein
LTQNKAAEVKQFEEPLKGRQLVEQLVKNAKLLELIAAVRGLKLAL